MQYKEYQIEDVKLIKITNSCGFELVLAPLGAAIYYIKYQDDYLTLTPKDIKDFAKDNVYYGKTIGPIANRVKDGIVILDNKKYQLDKNLQGNCLHGGFKGLGSKVFNYQINKLDDSIEIVFNYESNDMEFNLPGNVLYKVTYVIYDHLSEFKILFDIVSNKNTAICVTNHTYFNLGDADILNSTLNILSNSFLSCDLKDQTPIEIVKLIPCLDFNIPKSIGKDINDDYLIHSKAFGYDHHLYFDETVDTNEYITLEGKKYIMKISTNFCGTQIYTTNYDDHIPFVNGVKGTHKGIAIEPQDSLLGNHLLLKNTHYERFILYRFFKK